MENGSIEIRNGDKPITTEDLWEQPLWIKLALAAMLLTIVLMTLYIVGKTTPFEPLKVDNIYIEPSEACGGEEVQVFYNGELDGGLYTLDSLDGFAYWVSAEDSRPLSSIYFKVDEVKPYPKGEYEGPVRRVAPWPEDEWHAGADAFVYGKRFGFVPVVQEIHIESDDTLHTLDRNDSKCTTQK